MCVRNFVSDFAFQRTSMCAFKIDVHHRLVVAGALGQVGVVLLLRLYVVVVERVAGAYVHDD